MNSIFNLDYLGKVTGYLCGLAVMALVWLSIRFLTRQAQPRVLAWFLLAGLVVILSQLSLETFQILAGRRMLSRTMFSLVLYLLERKSLFLFAQVGVWGALGAWMIVTSTTLRAVNSRGPVISEPKLITLTAGMIRLDLGVISDGNLHRHAYQTEEGTPVRFIVIKKSQSAFGVGLDACDICGQSGYYQRGDQVICKLCDVVMNKSTIGFPGGCNPVPLSFTLSGGSLVIDPANLEAEVHRFK
jgi:uncharacterized membrane protein